MEGATALPKACRSERPGDAVPSSVGGSSAQKRCGTQSSSTLGHLLSHVSDCRAWVTGFGQTGRRDKAGA